MDQVTQQNAANAEETASSSEELSAQAESLKAIVDRIAKEVGTGEGKTTTSNKEDAQLKKKQVFTPSRKRTISTQKNADHSIVRGNKYEDRRKFGHDILNETLQEKNGNEHAVSVAKSNRIIPLSDDEFKDF